MSNDITIPLGLSKIEPDRVFYGFTLFATTLSSRVNLINLRGQVVHAWNTHRPVFYGYLLDNGNLLCGIKTDEVTPLPSGLTGSVMELDWDGKVVWEYRETGLHHDFCRSPNGNTMVLGYEPVPDNIASRVKGGAPGTELHGRMWSDYIREVTPKGETVWEWHASNCLNPEEDETCRLCNRQEWTHANSCKVLPDGNVMTSFRRLDSVAIIDKLSGRFHWRWGKGKIGHPHDPSLLESGNILVFDNGMHVMGMAGSKVIEVDPGSGEIVWEYKASPPWNFFSGHISGAQRLPNGNTLICEGAPGRIFEVTPQKEVVWEYRNPFFHPHPVHGRINSIFRAYRYGPDFEGFRGKELDPSRWGWLNYAL